MTRGLSAGRVQSVAVKLVVDREREIEAFKTEEYWKITALLTPQGLAKLGDFAVPGQGLAKKKGRSRPTRSRTRRPQEPTAETERADGRERAEGGEGRSAEDPGRELPGRAGAVGGQAVQGR